MNLRYQLSQVLLVAALLAPAVWAQDPFVARWEALRSGQPAGVEMRIAAPKAKFYLGEMILLTLSFTATQPRSFVAESRLHDRVGRMNYVDEFVVDPVAATEDPLRGLPGESGGMGGISGGDVILTADKPFHVERVLNEWVRFRTPGTYRLYVVSRRVRQVTGTGHTDLELRTLFAGKPADLASNVLTLEIAAAPAGWVAEQIATATAILDGPAGNEEERLRARRRAGLALRFLNTVESGTALARRLPEDNSIDAFAMHCGILDSSHRVQLLPVMERLLVAPGQAISERFLGTLAQLAVLVESGGAMPPYPSDAAAQQAWQAESRRRVALVAEKRDHFAATLVKSLPDKEPAARTLTRNGLLGVAEATGSRPSWLAGIVESLIADFRALPGRMQSSLLDSRWRLLRDRNVLPLLNALYENPPEPPVGFTPINELVLKRLYELDPKRGRGLILEELHRIDGPRAGDRTLMMLPDETLPELNDVFVAQIARGGSLPARLITRYATGAIVKEVEAGYLAFNAGLDRQNLPHCPFPLVFYFLKFDPEFGERELRKGFTAGQCYDIERELDGLGAHAMSPALERLAIEHLTSPIVPIKKSAAEVLGRYGSPAARKPLWETMEYFRSWWKDRGDELYGPAGQEGRPLERALRIALGQASAWVLGDAELLRLLELCSSVDCRMDVERWRRNASGPMEVEIVPLPDEMRIQVAQYTVVGEKDLAAKLGQFPAGSAFRIVKTLSEDAERVRPGVEAAIRAAGHRVVQ